MFGGPGGGELVAHGNLWEGQFVWVLEVCLIWEAHGQGLAREAPSPTEPPRLEIGGGGRGSGVTGWAKMGDFPPDARRKEVHLVSPMRVSAFLIENPTRFWGAVELGISPTEGPRWGRRGTGKLSLGLGIQRR